MKMKRFFKESFGSLSEFLLFYFRALRRALTKVFKKIRRSFFHVRWGKNCCCCFWIASERVILPCAIVNCKVSVELSVKIGFFRCFLQK